MMLREHLGQCTEMPEDLKKSFLELKENKSTPVGTQDAKAYWSESAMKLGLVETQNGLMMVDQRERTQYNRIAQREGEMEARTEQTRQPSLGPSNTHPVPESSIQAPLLSRSDQERIDSNYLFTLMSQAQRVALDDPDWAGARKRIAPHHPGFGCWRCCTRGRSGNCRFYATSRRLLLQRIDAFHDHLQRCTLCPQELRERLATLQKQEEKNPRREEQLKPFLDLIWARIYEGGGRIERLPN